MIELTTHDIALLDEIDEIFRRKLLDYEKSGADMDAMNDLADQYAKMFDLLDAKFTQTPIHDVSPLFRQRTYDFIIDCFLEKLLGIYEPGNRIPDAQSQVMIMQTREKLHRVRIALFDGKLLPADPNLNNSEDIPKPH